MTKVNFRARIDYSKQMQIYRNINQLPDLQDYLTIKRSMPRMPTGMVEVEENEHDLQKALSYQHEIPTPKVIIVNNEFYDRIYNFKFQKPIHYIQKVRSAWEAMCPTKRLDAGREGLETRTVYRGPKRNRFVTGEVTPLE